MVLKLKVIFHVIYHSTYVQVVFNFSMKEIFFSVGWMISFHNCNEFLSIFASFFCKAYYRIIV